MCPPTAAVDDERPKAFSVGDTPLLLAAAEEANPLDDRKTAAGFKKLIQKKEGRERSIEISLINQLTADTHPPLAHPSGQARPVTHPPSLLPALIPL